MIDKIQDSQMLWLPYYYDILTQFRGRIVVLVGGQGSGKSWHGVANVLRKIATYPHLTEWFVRKYQKDAVDSMFREAEKMIDLHSLHHIYRINQAEHYISCPAMKSKVICVGTSDIDKVKSKAQPTGALIDEADEQSEYDFNIINGRIRSKLAPYRQIVLCINPPEKRHWLPYKWYNEGRFMPDFLVPHIEKINTYDPIDKCNIASERLTLRTGFWHNKHLLPDDRAVILGYKDTDEALFDKMAKVMWGSSQIGVYFKAAVWEEYDNDIPNDARGAVYCDPNLAPKGKGDTTAIVKGLYSMSQETLYIPEIYVENTVDSTDLLNIIFGMIDHRTWLIGLDGNVHQEGVWSDKIKNSAMHAGKIGRVQFCHYDVDREAKSAQFLYNAKRIKFHKSIKNTLYGERFRDQLFGFQGKKNTPNGKHDDAPDALICLVKLMYVNKLLKIYR